MAIGVSLSMATTVLNAVCALLNQHDFVEVQSRQDLSGIERCSGKRAVETGTEHLSRNALNSRTKRPIEYEARHMTSLPYPKQETP
jgi:hypothetical protein